MSLGTGMHEKLDAPRYDSLIDDLEEVYRMHPYRVIQRRYSNQTINLIKWEKVSTGTMFGLPLLFSPDLSCSGFYSLSGRADLVTCAS